MIYCPSLCHVCLVLLFSITVGCGVWLLFTLINILMSLKVTGTSVCGIPCLVLQTDTLPMLIAVDVCLL